MGADTHDVHTPLPGHPSPTGTPATTPNPEGWLTLGLRRRAFFSVALICVAMGYLAAGVRVPPLLLTLLAMHLASTLTARELLPRIGDVERRDRVLTLIMCGEAVLIAAMTLLADGARWLGVSGLLLQQVMPGLVLPRRRLVMVAAIGSLAWWGVVFLEYRGLGGTGVTGTTSLEGNLLVTIASGVVSTIVLLFSAFALGGWRALVQEQQARLAASERRHRRTLQALRDVVVQIDAENRWSFVSEPWEGLTGQRPEAVIGRLAEASFAAADAPLVRDVLRDLREGRPHAAVELHVTGPSGERRTVEFRPQMGGEDALVTGTITDVTERVALREQLRSRERLEAVGRLAGGVAHDFNNVLTMIQMSAEHLAVHLGPSEVAAQEDVRTIVAASARGSALTRQLLALGRRQQVAPAVMDAGAVLDGLRPTLRDVLGADHALALQVARDVRVVADPFQLEQVAVNLLANARDASPAGSSVRLRLERRATGGAIPAPVVGADGRPAANTHGDAVPPGDWVVLRVEDDGAGMPESVLARAFDPFFTTKPAGTAAGLGLATVYGIARQLGGHTRIGTTPGVGTTVELFLPPASAPSSLEGTRSDTPAPRPTAGARQAILLVDDEALLRIGVRRMLERAGYEVVEAADGRQALAVASARQGRFDLVLSDVVMPGMSGREMMGLLKDDYPDLPFVFMSGFTADEAGHAAGSLDGMPLLQKPFTAETLLAMVRRNIRTTDAAS